MASFSVRNWAAEMLLFAIQRLNRELVSNSGKVCDVVFVVVGHEKPINAANALPWQEDTRSVCVATTAVPEHNVSVVVQ